MKVSIVTVSFNQGQFLQQSLLSVIEQDYPKIEYIVVDPGSADQSRAIIEKYADRISKVVLEPDQGAADGLKKGFSLATGDIYGFLNADDFLLPGAISHIVSCFNQSRSLDVISGHALIVDEHGAPVRRFYSDRFNLLSSAYGASILAQPSTFFTASSYKKTAGFNIKNRTNWDDELFMDLKLQGGTFGLTDRFLSAYRIHSQSITAAADDQMHAAIQSYASYRFNKIMGRSPRWYDRVAHWLFRIKKHLLNPLNLYEHLRHGPIYRRYRPNRMKK